jgi:hypothetical protein
LEKARLTVFGKLLLLLNDMRTNSAFSKFQVRVGGRFPKEEYEGYVHLSMAETLLLQKDAC